MKDPKDIMINSEAPQANPWRVFVEQENKNFLKNLFPEKGIQGYLYNFFLTKLRAEFMRKGIPDYLTRLAKTGNFEELLDNLKLTINTKDEN